MVASRLPRRPSLSGRWWRLVSSSSSHGLARRARPDERRDSAWPSSRRRTRALLLPVRPVEVSPSAGCLRAAGVERHQPRSRDWARRAVVSGGVVGGGASGLRRAWAAVGLLAPLFMTKCNGSPSGGEPRYWTKTSTASRGLRIQPPAHLRKERVYARVLRRQGVNTPIARLLGRHRSTGSREVDERTRAGRRDATYGPGAHQRPPLALARNQPSRPVTPLGGEFSEAWSPGRSRDTCAGGLPPSARALLAPRLARQEGRGLIYTHLRGDQESAGSATALRRRGRLAGKRRSRAPT